jgi:glycerate 2-kinase
VDALAPEPLVSSACARLSLDVYDPARFVVIAAGKAAPGMMRGLLAARPDIGRGLAAAQDERPAGVPVGVDWIVATHPAPDEGSERAGRRALSLAASLHDDDLLVVLLSGGASSMLAVPAEGITLEEKAATGHGLMAAGASIAELNCVRKHLSAIKGGWLGAAAGWRVLTLAISDVHGPVPDDPSVIGSGPAVGDPTTFADARAVAGRLGTRLPPAVHVRLEAGARGEVPETPKPDAAAGARVEVVANRWTALHGMRDAAAAAGYAVLLVEEPTSGEARRAGEGFVREAARLAEQAGRPACVIAAGETVVTVTGDGRGGRNQEFVLGALPAFDRLTAEGIVAVLASAGTDGIDGPTDAAGGIVDTTTARRARDAGVDIGEALRRNDAYPALSALGDLVTWGPTGTNVGDLHVLLCSRVAARGT